MEKFKAKWKQNDCLCKVGKMKDEEEIRTHKEIYKATKTEAKLVVKIVKTTIFKQLYAELGDRG